jgi:hypothetical protein
MKYEDYLTRWTFNLQRRGDKDWSLHHVYVSYEVRLEAREGATCTYKDIKNIPIGGIMISYRIVYVPSAESSRSPQVHEQQRASGRRGLRMLAVVTESPQPMQQSQPEEVQSSFSKVGQQAVYV